MSVNNTILDQLRAKLYFLYKSKNKTPKQTLNTIAAIFLKKIYLTFSWP